MLVPVVPYQDRRQSQIVNIGFTCEGGKAVSSKMLTSVTQSVPRGAVLDAWSGSQWDNGLQIDRMGELTTVAVRTARSLYEITILNGCTGEVLVRGGGFFPERTPVQLTGSTFGGSILKRRGIYVGMRLEFVPQPAELVSETIYDAATGQSEIRAGHRVIWTSLIQSVEVVS